MIPLTSIYRRHTRRVRLTPMPDEAISGGILCTVCRVKPAIAGCSYWLPQCLGLQDDRVCLTGLCRLHVTYVEGKPYCLQHTPQEG